jgi:hypothetical protein
MKLKSLFFPLLITVFAINLLSSCKEFIEPSINKRQVQLNAPANQYQSTSYTINFWWNEVEDALSYHLQVVTPTFDSIGGLVIDTLVKGTKFSLTMNPGNYEWRVRAENGSSQTNYSAPLDFTVLASSLTGQTIMLSAPTNNTLTNQAAVTFKWGSLYNATKYHIQIDSNNFANESTVVKDQIIPGQQFAFSFPKNQVYQWRVRAENDTEQSKWSTIYLITYDNTRPAAVTLNQPQNNATISQPVSLTWNTVTSAVKYKLSVYKSDSTTPYNNTFPVIVNTTSFSFNAGSSGERIFWKVSAINAAGNEGQSSDLRSFVLQ